MATALDNQIKALVQKTVKEALRAELAQLRGGLLPFVSKKEIEDITRRYKKPVHRVVRTIRIAR